MAIPRIKLPLGCLFILVIVSPFVMIGLLVVATVVIGAGTVWVMDFANSSWINGLAVLLLVTLIHFATRYGYAFLIDRTMRQRLSSVEEEKVQIEFEMKSEASGSSSPQLPPLSYQVYNEDANALIDTKEEEIVYAQLLNKPGRILFAGMGAGLLASLILSLVLASMRTGISVFSAGGFPFLSMQLAAHLVAFAVGSIMYLRSFRIGVVGLLLVGSLANVFNAGYSFLSTLEAFGDAHLVPDMALENWFPFEPLLAYSGCVVITGLISWRKSVSVKKMGFAPGLLVLRVFGLDRHTQTLFHHIGRRWLALGPLMTIIDTTYARFEFGRRQMVLLGISVIPALLAASIRPGDGALIGFLAVTGACLYVPVLLGFFLFRWYRIRHEASRNLDALQNRMALEHRTLVSWRFKQGRLLCYGDFWQTALERMVLWADVVLMDLRGFSHTNKGCEYELNFLLNRMRLDRVAFLVDASTDQDLLRDAIDRSWHTLGAHSPNRDLPAPVVTLYEARAGFEPLERRLLPLLSLLSDRAASASVGGLNRENMAALHRAEKETVSAVVPEHRVAQLKRAIVIAWGVVVAGLTMMVIFDDEAALVGLGVAWTGILLLMLATRTRTMYKRDGHLQKFFKGYPWPLLFFLLAAGWVYWCVAMPFVFLLGTVWELVNA